MNSEDITVVLLVEAVPGSQFIASFVSQLLLIRAIRVDNRDMLTTRRREKTQMTVRRSKRVYTHHP